MPKYEYAPWVVVDGVPMKEDAYSLKEFVCNAYQGEEPLECSPAMLKDYFPRRSTELHHQVARHVGTGQKHRAKGDSEKKGHIQALSVAPADHDMVFQKCVKSM
jgi:hypothetical protein